MKSYRVWACVLVLALCVLSVGALSQGESVAEVTVRNFPRTYDVQGSVSINGIIHHSQMIKRENVVVTNSHRNEAAELIYAGTVDTDGFTSVTLSLQGEFKSNTPGDGTAGVMLLPDEEPVFRALRDAKRVEFPIEASYAFAKGASPYFDAASVTLPLAFPRYKIVLYNTAPQAFEGNVYVYLKN